MGNWNSIALLAILTLKLDASKLPDPVWGNTLMPRDSESHPFEFAYFDTSKDKRDFLCRYPERYLQQLAPSQCFDPNIVVCV